MAEWVNTVPQGVAGTGNAVIYGDNPVAAQFGNQLGRYRQNEYNDQLYADQLAQRQAEQQAKIWRDNQLAASSGRLWASDIGKIEQDHLQKGIELKQKGIDPYGYSPEALAYQQERRQVQSQQGFRKATETQYNALSKLIAANPDKYEPKDIQAVNDFFNGKLSDAYSGNVNLPQLRERFKANEYLKGLQAISQEDVSVRNGVKSDKKYLNRQSTENAIIGRLSQDDRGKEYLNSITGGIPVNEIRTFSPRLEENTKRVANEVKGDPKLLLELAKNGIVPGTPEMNGFINQLAQTQTQARRNFDTEIGQHVAASMEGMTLYDKQTPDYGAERMDIARERLQMAQDKAAGSEKINPTLEARKQWIADIKNGVPNSGEKLLEFVNGDPNYSSTTKPAIYHRKGDNEDEFTIDIPAKIKLDSKGDEVTVLDRQQYRINRNDPNFEIKMNQIINSVTGQTMDIGASVGLRGNSKGTTVKVTETAKSNPSQTYKIRGKDYSNDAIQKAAKASDMSIAEYVKMANK